MTIEDRTAELEAALEANKRESLWALSEGIEAISRSYAEANRLMREKLDETREENERLRETLEASEDYRRAYQSGKYSLYAMADDKISSAVMQHLPCNEGPLDRRFRELIESPRLKARDGAIARLREENERLKEMLEKADAFDLGEDYQIIQHPYSYLHRKGLLKGYEDKGQVWGVGRFEPEFGNCVGWLQTDGLKFRSDPGKNGWLETTVFGSVPEAYAAWLKWREKQGADHA